MNQILSPWNHRACFHVRLPGGIGNQLFALFAARYMSQLNGITHHLFFNEIDYSHNHQFFDIRSFRLTNLELNCKKYSSKILFPGYGSSQTHSSISSKARIRRMLFTHNFSINDADNIDSVTDFFSNERTFRNYRKFPKLIEGFFSDFGFYDNLWSCESRDLFLKSPSNNFQKLQNELTERRVLGIHVRMGDYLRSKDGMGVLSDEYFHSAIKLMMNLSSFSEVWIFSDSPTLTEKRIPKWKVSAKVRVLPKNKETDPSEQLMLLSQCQGIICSNSTFSFWAAKLSQKFEPLTPTIIPSQYRKDEKSKVLNIPETWMTIPSKWL